MPIHICREITTNMLDIVARHHRCMCTITNYISLNPFSSDNSDFRFDQYDVDDRNGDADKWVISLDANKYVNILTLEILTFIYKNLSRKDEGKVSLGGI